MNWYPTEVSRIRTWGERPFVGYCYFVGLWDLAFDLGGLPDDKNRVRLLAGLNRKQIDLCWEPFRECCLKLENGRLMPVTIIEAEKRMRSQTDQKRTAGKLGGHAKAGNRQGTPEPADFNESNNLPLAAPDIENKPENDKNGTDLELPMHDRGTVEELKRNSNGTPEPPFSSIPNDLPQAPPVAESCLHVRIENKEKEIREEREIAGENPAPLPATVWQAFQELFPGEATNHGKMKYLADIATKYHAQVSDVLRWQAWLQSRQPGQIASYFKCRDTFHLMMEEGVGAAGWLNGSVGSRFCLFAIGFKPDAPISPKTRDTVISTGKWLDKQIDAPKAAWIERGITPENFDIFWENKYPTLDAKPKPESIVRHWDEFLTWLDEDK